MKFIKLLLFSFITFFCAATLPAQDIHFSMFDMSPLTMNPAHTGSFLGTIRVGGIHRSQWQSSTSDFATTSLYADSPILAIGKKKRDWIGVGVTLLQDVAGQEKDDFGSLTTSFMIPSVAIHKVLDKKGKNVLTFGVQVGAVSREISLDGLTFADELPASVLSDPGNFIGQGGSADRNNLAGKTVDNGVNIAKINPFTDASAGLLLTSKISEKSDVVIGLAAGHLVKIGGYNLIQGSGGQGGQGIGGNNKIPSILKRPSTIKFHATLNQKLTDQWSIHPTAFFQTTKGLSELIVQGNAGYQLNEDIRLNGGLGYRLGDAAMILAGANYKDWRVGLSYDLTLGQVANAGLQNAFEVGVSYIIKIFQEPVVDPVILCPKF